MGRRKIDIKPITNERNRSVTFLKRKNGLFKKAYELGVLCSVDVAVIIFGGPVGQKYKLYEYCSTDIDKMVKKRLNFTGERDAKGPEDFGDKDKDGGAGEDDDDEDSDPGAGPSKGKATKAGKASGSGIARKASGGAKDAAIKSDDELRDDVPGGHDLAMDVEPPGKLPPQSVYPQPPPLPISGERHHHHHPHPHKRQRRDSSSTASSHGYGQYPAPPPYNALEAHHHHHHQPGISPPQPPLAALFSQHRASLGGLPGLSNMQQHTANALGGYRVATAPPAPQLPMNVSINISRELMDAFGLAQPPQQFRTPSQPPPGPPPAPLSLTGSPGGFDWPHAPQAQHAPAPDHDTTWLDIFSGGGGGGGGKKESPPAGDPSVSLAEFFGNVAALADNAGGSGERKRRWDGS